MFSPGQQIKRHDDGELLVSTVLAGDTGLYETGVSHEEYHPEIVIVQEYKTEEQAIEGHAKWLQKMLDDPSQDITDVSSSIFAVLLSMFSGDVPPGNPDLN